MLGHSRDQEVSKGEKKTSLGSSVGSGIETSIDCAIFFAMTDWMETLGLHDSTYGKLSQNINIPRGNPRIFTSFFMPCYKINIRS